MPFAYVGVAIAVIGAATAAYSSYQQGQAQSAADNYNAEVASNNAIAAQQQAQQNAQLQQQAARQKLGAITAAYGASGIDSGSGSALDVLSMSASNSELDRQTILYKGQLQANGYTDEAQLDQTSASNAKTQGDEKASAQLLAGIGSAAGKFNYSGSSTSNGGNISGNGSGDNISGGN